MVKEASAGSEEGFLPGTSAGEEEIGGGVCTIAGGDAPLVGGASETWEREKNSVNVVESENTHISGGSWRFRVCVGWGTSRCYGTRHLFPFLRGCRDRLVSGRSFGLGGQVLK